MRIFVIASFVVACLYAGTIPYSGSSVNVDNAVSVSIPYTAECKDKVSTANMSIRLAIVNMGVMFIVSILLLAHEIVPRGKGTLWPTPVLWVSVLIAFITQLIVFGSLVTRIGVWFLSCNSTAKLDGACPVTKYEAAVGVITDAEQCHFSPTSQIPFSNADAYITCHNSSTTASYNSQFLLFNMPQYYSRKAVCSLGLEDDLGAIDWCFHWGCSRVCNPDTYYKNWMWFVLDCISFMLVVVGYMLLMHKWTILSEDKKRQA